MPSRPPHARRARAARGVAVVLAVTLLATGAVAALSAGAEADATFEVRLSGTTAAVRLPRPPDGRRCDTATGRRLSDEVRVPAGGLERRPADAAVSLDLVRAGGRGTYLSDGTVTLSTARGAVRLRLSAGDCAAPGLTEDAGHVAGSGTWTVEALPPGTGAGGYRGATGSGTFELAAGLRGGAANAWSLRLAGDLTVLQPRIAARLVRSYWSHAGVDYAGRLASAVYELTNTGAGEAHDAVVTAATGPAGVTPLHFRGESLGALAPGETVRLTVRWRVKGAPGQGPVLTGRQFAAELAVVAHDVRDEARAIALSVATVTPAFPPAL